MAVRSRPEVDMSLGPFEFVVLAFPGQGLAPDVRTALECLAEAGDLRVADALVVRKDSSGTTRVAELRTGPSGYGAPSLESLGLAGRRSEERRVGKEWRGR